VLDIVEGIYIPITDDTSPEIKALSLGSDNPYDIEGQSKILRLRKLTKIREIILQLSQYIYLTYRLSTPGGSLVAFTRDYLSVGAVSGTVDSANIYNFSRLPRILPKQMNIAQLMEYLGNVIPTFCRSGKCWLYSDKLMKGVVYYLQSYENFYKGLPVNLPKELKGLYKHEADFRSYPNTFVFVGTSDLKTWIYQKTRQGLPVGYVTSKLAFEYSAFKDPYWFKDEFGSLFIIQNVAELKFDRAINVAYIWYVNRRNEGYDTAAFPSGDTYPRYVLYELGSNGGLVPTEDHTVGDNAYLRIFKYSKDSYAAILPVL
jgi:hypothetical protein